MSCRALFFRNACELVNCILFFFPPAIIRLSISRKTAANFLVSGKFNQMETHLCQVCC